MAVIETSTAVVKLKYKDAPRLVGTSQSGGVKTKHQRSQYVWYEIFETNGNVIGTLGIKKSVANSGSLADAGVVLSTA